MAMKKQADYGDVTDRSLVFKTYGMTVIAAVMGAIVYLSLILLFNGLFTKSVGYTLYEKNEDGSLTKLETHYFQEGEGPDMDIPLEENQTYQIFRSELAGGALIAYRLITQLLMAILLWLFPFNLLRERGEKDRTLVVADCRTEDLWRGARVGLFAAIPSLASFVFFIIVQAFKEPASWLFTAYRIANLSFDPLLLWMMPDGNGKNFFIQAVCLVMALSVPMATALGYWMGYRNVHPVRNLIYPNQKTKS